MSESVCTEIRKCVNMTDANLWFQCVQHVKDMVGGYMYRDTHNESPFIIPINNDSEVLSSYPSTMIVKIQIKVKTKAAALEIEKMVKEFAQVNETVQIKKLLKVLEEFATSQNTNTKKGGLIGLAAIAIALGKDTALYTDELIQPILACFSDSDLRVRYYACESLYNVVKVARGAVLPHFTDIFNALSKLAADPDQNVKNGSELLDRLMKDIVTESSSFDLVAFMPLLREKIYTNHTLEIKKMCDTVLGEFLRSIKQDPNRVDFAGMINIVIFHSQAADDMLQFTALTWIKEFVQLSGRMMLPFASGILTAVLPCLSYDNIRETARAVNFSMMKLITAEDNRELPDTEYQDTEQAVEKLDLPSVVDVLIKHLSYTSVHTKVAVLRWIYHLHIKVPNKMFRHVQELFPVLLRTLSDTSDEVVQQDLEVLAEIISSPAGRTHSIPENNQLDMSALEKQATNNKNPYFSKFMVSLLHSFSSDQHHLLEDRGAFIIRQLCVLLNSEDIYRSLAEILLHEKQLKFASIMVQTLNSILLTSSELFQLRNKLKDLNSEESCVLFCCLYKSWSHNPVATVALCFLTQSYRHVCDLIHIFADLEITVEFLTEIDKLVQLIESPIFTYLRLELLAVPCNQHLVQALYGLLMLLPQTEAFNTLRQRLDCVSSLHLHYCADRNDRLTNMEEKNSIKAKHIDFSELLEHFVSIQEQHRQDKNVSRTKILLDKGIHTMSSIINLFPNIFKFLLVFPMDLNPRP
ncbi:hypothetical protein L9F63_006122, partial [Diploptera punctata]